MVGDDYLLLVVNRFFSLVPTKLSFKTCLGLVGVRNFNLKKELKHCNENELIF